MSAIVYEMPNFAVPAAVDDADAHPDAVRLVFELGRLVVMAHLLERAAANLWMDLSPAAPQTLAKRRKGFPPWSKILDGLAAAVEDRLACDPMLEGLRQAISAARHAQERRDRLVHDLTGLDISRDPPEVVRLEWDPAIQKRREVIEPPGALQQAGDDLMWAGRNLLTLSEKLRANGLLHHDVANGDWN